MKSGFSIFIFSMWFGLGNCYSQIMLPAGSYNKMEALALELVYPVDQSHELKLKRYNRNSYAKEDFALFYGDTDVLVFLYPFETMKFDFPHLEFNRVITHLASNAPDDHIFVYSLPGYEGVDWAGEARFKAKDNVSSKRFATAQGYFREQQGMYIVVYLDSKLKTSFNKVMAFKDLNPQNQK